MDVPSGSFSGRDNPLMDFKDPGVLGLISGLVHSPTGAVLLVHLFQRDLVIQSYFHLMGKRQ